MSVATNPMAIMAPIATKVVRTSIEAGVGRASTETLTCRLEATGARVSKVTRIVADRGSPFDGAVTFSWTTRNWSRARVKVTGKSFIAKSELDAFVVTR